MTNPNRDPTAAELADLRQQVAFLTERVDALTVQSIHTVPRKRKPLLCRIGLHNTNTAWGVCLRCYVPESKSKPAGRKGVHKELLCGEHKHEKVGSCLSYDHYVCSACSHHERRKAHNLDSPSGCPICSKIDKAQRAELGRVAEGLRL